jgi:chemotaxis protein methyltransferase CheR
MKAEMVMGKTPPLMATGISANDFQKFSEFFYRKTGISFEPSKRYFVDKRIVARIEASGCENFRAYFTMMRFQVSGEELQALTNIMTINETYFLREEYQFQCLVNSMLPEIISRKTDTSVIRIWCMPSSSGEEPYSIAMYLLENWAEINIRDVELVASDIDTGILKKARAGLFPVHSLQHVPESWRMKYFTRRGDDYQICEELRNAVEFTRVNLTEPAETRSYRDFDVIFCRNLLIYFDEVSRREAAATFYDALKPGGYICLGHSESMSRISSLYKVCKFPEAIVYQKPLEGK